MKVPFSTFFDCRDLKADGFPAVWSPSLLLYFINVHACASILSRALVRNELFTFLHVGLEFLMFEVIFGPFRTSTFVYTSPYTLQLYCAIRDNSATRCFSFKSEK